MNPFEYLTERQYSWARRHGITIDEAGYTDELNDNLFLPLAADAFQEFPGGRNGHLGDSIHAAHSSAALVVNVFNYWRLYHQLGPIIAALSPGLVDYQVQGIRFEAPYPIQWPVPPRDPRNPPQLDVIIRYRDRDEAGVTRAIAVESKFREPYGNHRDEFAACYLADENRAIWAGIEPLRAVAHQIHGREIGFRRLHVSQLIKHILGLNSSFKGVQNFELLYLWYAAPGQEALDHEEEIGRFQRMTNDCNPRVNFRAIKYQDLIHTLALAHGDVHGAYADYLLERYF